MTDAVTIRVVEGETGPRLVFTRPVEFVEVPYDSVPALINELVLEFGRRRTGLTQQKTKNNLMMDPDEVNEWATTPELRDFEAFLENAGFHQYAGRLASKSQYEEGYLTWCNGTLGEGKTVVPWRPEMMLALQEFFLMEKERMEWTGIVWRKCPSFEMRAGFGRVLKMRFHFIHVTNI